MAKMTPLTEVARRLGMSTEKVRPIALRAMQANHPTMPTEVTEASLNAYIEQQTHSLGVLAIAIFQAEAWNDRGHLERHRAAAPTATSTADVGQDGGFAIGPDIAPGILHSLDDGHNLVSKTRRILTPRNTITVPMDRKPPHAAGGVQARWIDSQGEALTQSKPLLETAAGRLNKLAAFVPITEELLSDAPSLGEYLLIAAPEAIAWAADFAFFWSIGGARPLGFMQSPALIVVSAEAGQTADTIVGANIVKMFSRLAAASIPRALWFVHPDAMTQIININTNGVELYTSGDAEAPAGRLLGRPVWPHEACTQLGDLGDIVLIDPMEYLRFEKTPALKTQISPEIWFDQDLFAFKFTFRVQGQPAWSEAVASRVGGTTRSPYISLAAR